MGRTMTLKDDFGVIAWTWRAGNYLSLLLLLSLFSSSALSDIPFPKNQHFSWKTGKSTLLHFKLTSIYVFDQFTSTWLEALFHTHQKTLLISLFWQSIYPVKKLAQPPKFPKKVVELFSFSETLELAWAFGFFFLPPTGVEVYYCTFLSLLDIFLNFEV